MAYQFPLNGGRINASIGGNSTSAGAGYSLISTGNMVLAGGTNITLSQNGQSISIVGGGGGGAALSAAGSSIGSGTVVFSNSNGVGFGMNGSTITASHNGITSQSAQTIGGYASGNTTGQSSSSTFDARSMSVSGLGALSAGWSGGMLQMSAPAQSSLSQTGALSISRNGSTISIGVPAVSMGMSGGNTSGTSGTVSNQLVFAGGNNITLSQATGAGGNSISVSGVSFSNLNGFTFGLNGGTLTASHNGITSQSNQSVGIYATGANTTGQSSSNTLDARSLNISAMGGLYAGMSGSTLQLSAATTYAASNHSHGNPTLNLTNLSGTTASASNGLTLSLSAGAQSVQSIGIYATGANTTGQSSSNTIDARSFVVSGQGMYAGMSGSTLQLSAITTYAASNHSHGNPTLNLTNLSGTTASASNGLTLSLSAGAQTNQTLGGYMLGNTTGQSSSSTFDARTMSINGAGNVSVGYSAGSMVISGGTAAASPVNFSAGTTSGNLGSVVFSNLNGVSFGLNGSTITASAAGGGGGVNIAASNTTYTSGTVVMSNNGGALTISSGAQSVLFSVPATSSIVATGALSVSTNVSTISMGVPSPITWNHYNPLEGYALAVGQHGAGTVHIQPMFSPNIQFDRIVLPMAYSNASNSSGSQTVSFYVGVYTRNASTLSLAASTSASIALTASGTVGVYSLYGGNRLFTIGSTSSLSEGEYYLGIMSKSTSGGANASFSQLVVSQISTNFTSFGGVFGVASNASNQFSRGLGYYSASSASMPGSIGFSEIRGTASMAMRQPAIYFVSQTV